MTGINLNEFAAEVHQNAVAHGWWEGERTEAELRDLLHCELSEAMESYRRKEPLVWHKCPHVGAMCETVDVHSGSMDCANCAPSMRKPEGAAVELIDFCIRVLDWRGAMDIRLPKHLEHVNELCTYTLVNFQDEIIGDPKNIPLPGLIDLLHVYVVNQREYGFGYLQDAVGIAFAWLEEHGLDPVDLMLEKHDYNKGRTYRHGGKRC